MFAYLEVACAGSTKQGARAEADHGGVLSGGEQLLLRPAARLPAVRLHSFAVQQQLPYICVSAVKFG